MRGVAVLGLAALAGCTLVAEIDVCDRERPVAHEVNVRGEGAQAVSGAQPAAALAAGGALVVFRSAVAADDVGVGESTIRIALVGSDGRAAERTCDAAGENEIVGRTAGTRFDEASIAMSAPTDDVGLVVYAARTSMGTSVRGVFVSAAGCVRTPLLVPDFAISDRDDASPDFAPTPSVAALGDRVFLVGWTYVRVTPTGLRSEVRLRVVRSDAVYMPEFLPTEADATGASSRLRTAGSVATSGRVSALGAGRAAITWNVIEGREISPHFMVVDDRLATLVSERAVDRLPIGDGVRAPRVRTSAVAFDGTRILVVWTYTERDEYARIKGRYYDAAGASLPSSISLAGEPFVLRDDVTPQDEGRVALAPLSGGGFLAAMEPLGGEGERVQGLAARLFGADGAPAFANAACDARSFTLTSSDGSVADPALVRLSNGAVLLVHTSDGATGADRSGSGVRATALAPRDLLAIP